MRRPAVAFFAVLLFGLAAPNVRAATIGLFEYAFNLDGTVGIFDVDPRINFSSFDIVSGLGTVTVTMTGAGSHYVSAFVDHDIDESINTYYNEYGAIIGEPVAGQSWEIDKPGWGLSGDIYDNFTAGTLDNSNGVPVSSPDDVSMAMGWDFMLAAGETATIKFLFGVTAPGGGFYLAQTDPDSAASIYFSSSNVIGDGGGPVVPEPSTMILLLSGLGVVAAARFRKSA
jgi:hypothetical protein